MYGAIKGDVKPLHEAAIAWLGADYKIIDDTVSCEIDSDGFVTNFDELPQHLATNYGDRRYEQVLKGLEDYDFITISDRMSWGAGSYGESSKTTYFYEVLGVHAHTKRVFEALYDSEKPILIFARVLQEERWFPLRYKPFRA